MKNQKTVLLSLLCLALPLTISSATLAAFSNVNEPHYSIAYTLEQVEEPLEETNELLPVGELAPRLASTATVTDVSISGPTNVDKGTTVTFTAIVTGTGNPSQTVTWMEKEHKSENTTIGKTTGVLTIGADETASKLVIWAISADNSKVMGKYAVTINGNGGSNVGMIVGITIGSVLGFGLILYLIGYFFFYRKNKLFGKALEKIYKFLPKGGENKNS